MGGNPAENHPCGFKWAIEAKKTRERQARRRRSALHAHGGRRRPLRARSAPGTDIAFLLGIIRYAHRDSKRFHEEYVKLHTNALLRRSARSSASTTASSAASTRRRASTTRPPGPTRPTRRPKAYAVDPTLQHPRCVFQLLKKHVDRYTPEMVERICGTPKETVPEGLPRSSPPPATRERVGTITYALGLDPALDRRADHPRRGDAAAPARQRRPAGRRRERAPRPLQHPGRDRHGRARSRSCPATSRRRPARSADARGLPRDGHAHDAEQAGVGVDELLDELPEVHGLAAQGHLRQGRDEGERLRLRLAAQGRRQLLVDVHLRRHVPGPLDARRAARSRGRRASSPSA